MLTNCQNDFAKLESRLQEIQIPYFEFFNCIINSAVIPHRENYCIGESFDRVILQFECTICVSHQEVEAKWTDDAVVKQQ